MSTPILRPVATVTVIDEHGDPLEVTADDARITIDTGAVPYGEARIQIPLIDPDTIEVIDPRDDVRAAVAIGEDGDTPRTFDLGIRSRQVDHKSKRIRLELATDEALLQDYAPLEDDDTPRDHEASLRDLVNYVLDVVIPGAELEAGATDADLTAAWPLTNLHPNPSVETNLDGWSNGSNATGITRLNAYADDGDYSIRAAAAAAGGFWIDYASNPVGVREGYLYSCVARMRVAVGATERTGLVMIRWYDINGTRIKDTYGSDVALSNTGYRTVSVTGTAPPGSVKVSLHFRLNDASSGQYLFVDNVSLNEGVPAEPFNGGTPDDALYIYSWDGETAHASPSSRTPIVERLPELFTWPAGVSAWDFLQPLTTVAGLRLYCDENRVWRLVDPAEFAAPGRVTLSPLNSTEGIDEISRENADIYCTGVVVKYSWTDPSGAAKTAIDSAGEAGRVFIVEMNRPYPGPGVAAAILARRQGQGRTQDVTALAVWAAQPGQEASISLPGTLEQIGRVASVEWTLPDGLMRVGTTGLVDVPPEAWLALDPGESWLDSPIGESWTGEVVA